LQLLHFLIVPGSLEVGFMQLRIGDVPNDRDFPSLSLSISILATDTSWDDVKPSVAAT
jgi:hypothetical protein